MLAEKSAIPTLGLAPSNIRLDACELSTERKSEWPPLIHSGCRAVDARFTVLGPGTTEKFRGLRGPVAHGDDDLTGATTIQPPRQCGLAHLSFPPCPQRDSPAALLKSRGAAADGEGVNGAGISAFRGGIVVERTSPREPSQDLRMIFSVRERAHSPCASGELAA